MHVGICEVTIRLHEVASLKEKRAVTKSVLAKLRLRFNVSASEVCHLDQRDLVGLGLGAVSNAREVIDRTFSGVLKYLQQDRVLDVESFEQSWL